LEEVNTSSYDITKMNYLYLFRVCKNNHDNALKFIYILIHSSPSTLSTNRSYLSVDDWDYLVQDIIDTHPGLKFLREAREFHSRYIKTVVARVYYNCNRSWSTKLTVQEIRRSNFLQVEKLNLQGALRWKE
jgi:serine/threonine-protein phosphatase 2A regulatory subunit B''